MAVAIDGDGDSVDLDKIWHVVHYAMTGTGDETDHPLGFLLDEGDESDDFLDQMDGGLFSPAACAQIAAAFGALSDATVEANLASPDAEAADLYRWPPEPGEVLPLVHALAALFDTAVRTRRGVGVIVY